MMRVVAYTVLFTVGVGMVCWLLVQLPLGPDDKPRPSIVIPASRPSEASNHDNHPPATRAAPSRIQKYSGIDYVGDHVFEK